MARVTYLNSRARHLFIFEGMVERSLNLVIIKRYNVTSLLERIGRVSTVIDKLKIGVVYTNGTKEAIHKRESSTKGKKRNNIKKEI